MPQLSRLATDHPRPLARGRTLLSCGVGFALSLTLAACSKAPGTTDASAAPAQPAATGRASGRGGGRGDAGGPVPVSTAHVIEKSLPVTVGTVGNVEASSTVEVRPQVSGPIMSIEFTEGQEVTAGQLLVTIDARPFEIALRQAEATLAKDTALADNANVQLKRNADLLARGLMTRADHDTFAAGVKSQQETLKADQAQVENARLQVQYTRIAAPISGRTGALAVRQGSLARTADTAPLVVINQVTPVRVAFAVPATLLPQIRAGQSRAPLVVLARTSGPGGSTSSGVLSFLDNAVDMTTGTIRLKATFPNQDRRLWPGEFVEITVRLSVEPHALVVPAVAVQSGQQGPYVYVVGADHSAAVRPVTVARADGDDAVIGTGLAAGEEVVTDGQLRLRPGVKVTVKPPVGGRSGS